MVAAASEAALLGRVAVAQVMAEREVEGLETAASVAEVADQEAVATVVEARAAEAAAAEVAASVEAHLGRVVAGQETVEREAVEQETAAAAVAEAE